MVASLVYLKLILYHKNKTTWNSVVDMLQTSLPYAAVFETWYERGGVCPQITNSEWLKVKILCDLLLLLKDATVLLSSSNIPTSHHIFTEMFDLMIHIETCIGQAMDMKDHDDEGTRRVDP